MIIFPVATADGDVGGGGGRTVGALNYRQVRPPPASQVGRSAGESTPELPAPPIFTSLSKAPFVNASGGGDGGGGAARGIVLRPK